MAPAHYIITPSDLDCDLDETSRGDAAFAITHYVITPCVGCGTEDTNVRKNQTLAAALHLLVESASRRTTSVWFFLTLVSSVPQQTQGVIDIMGNGKSRVAPRGFVEITVEIARSNDIKRGRQTPLVTAVSLVMRERTKRWAALCFLPALILTGDA